MSSDCPDWFQQAIATPSNAGRVEVHGCNIAYRWWGEASRPSLFLIHGYNAHSHWWDFIAPGLLPDYHVVAIDTSGAGDSGHRDRYDLDTFADEVIAVATAAGVCDRFTLVGHSFGAGIALKTATRFPDRVQAVIFLDAKVVPLPDEARPRSTSGYLPHQIFADEADAIANFRVIPPQRCPNQYIIDHIARHSIKPEDGGWTLKADAKLLDRFKFEDQTDSLLALKLRFGVIYGTISALMTPNVVDYLQYVAPPRSPFVAIPAAAHHLFLDQPQAFTAELKAMLDHWR